MTVRLGSIPRASDIDYNGTEEVYAYSRLLGRLVEVAWRTGRSEGHLLNRDLFAFIAGGKKPRG